MTAVATPPAPAASSASASRRSVADRRLLVDLGFSAVLASLGVIGFRSSFGGQEAYAVGIPAVVCGLLVGFVLLRVRPPLLVGAAGSAVVFFALGGAVALRSDATAGILPNGEVLSGLADGVVNGWARLLTSVPPAGEAGHLLAIPYLAGFAGGLLAIVVASAVPRWPLCVIPPSAVLAVSVLFGTEKPASRLLQGAVFGAVVVAWICLRADRSDRPSTVHGGRQRLVGGTALLAVAVMGAFVVGPNLPFADTDDRYILRDDVRPPFDPSQYPSPLARFRVFHGDEQTELEGPLLIVEELPTGESVRFAVMDSYDGYVWRAAQPGTDLGGSYLRVGEDIPDAVDGEQITVRFEMGRLADNDSVWIPTVGSPTSIRFTGARAEELTEEFRFNRRVEASASPMALDAGDTWEVDAVLVPEVGEAVLKTSAVAADPLPVPELSEDAKQRILEWTEGAESPYDQVQAVASRINEAGAYNDGDREPRVPSGHSLARLMPFLLAEQPNGNGEQYAAAVAYAANAIGIPARVVLEMENTEGEDPFLVEGDDLKAVVEIALQGVGWVAVSDPTPPESDQPEPEVTTPPEQATNEVQPPPPTTVPPPVNLPEEPEPDEADEDSTDSGGASAVVRALLFGLRLAAIPLLLLLVPGLLVVGYKARRRRQRRNRGGPAVRVASAWDEVADLARDLGQPVPRQATRREVARFASLTDIEGFASRVDSSIFGPPDPDDGAAANAWTHLDTMRKAALGSLPLLERIRTLTSLSSLRGVR